MNALLYGLVVVIWGTTWIAIFLQQGPVAAPVSIFWRFAVASLTMMVVLLALRRLRKLALRDHLFACFRDAAFSALTSGVFTPQPRTSIPGWNR
jgi:drug/metabolite transporter (DMT)-like permease